MTHLRPLLTLSALLFLPLAALAQFSGPQPGTGSSLSTGRGEQPLPADQAFQLTMSMDRGRLVFTWDIEEGYYLYRKSISLRAEPASALGDLRLPDGEQEEDAFFGEVEIYRDQLQARASYVREHGVRGPVIIDLEYQGCAEGRYCYPIIRKTFSLE